MGDARLESSQLVGLLEQLMAQRSNNSSLQSGYDELKDVEIEISSGGHNVQPDSAPQEVRVGVTNPYALVEALLGRRIDRTSPQSAKILAHVLQTDYDELFDMKHDSVLFAGLKLDTKQRRAQRLSENEIKLLNERDLETPDLSGVQRIDDLQKLGMKDICQAHVKGARLQNGKLHLIVEADQLAQTVSNRKVTMSVRELITPFRQQKGLWSPPNCSWHDRYDELFQHNSMRQIGSIAGFQINEEMSSRHAFDDPVQGCTANSWLIAALFSVFWADPTSINRNTRVYQNKDDREDKRTLAVKLFDKGGNNNSRTETVEVNYEIPLMNSINEPLYCRSSDGASIWPSLYEKAFAKWITNNSSQHPDITQTHSGDPVKAMSQINGREPQYFQCEKHSANDLLGIVRFNCLNLKTMNPMVGWTYPTGNNFKGANLVANHAYSILGYCVVGERQYIVMRNPWGVTEPSGLADYPGMMTRVDSSIWHPASLADQGGILAMEPNAFKESFEYIGTSKEVSKK